MLAGSTPATGFSAPHREQPQTTSFMSLLGRSQDLDTSAFQPAKRRKEQAAEGSRGAEERSAQPQQATQASTSGTPRVGSLTFTKPYELVSLTRRFDQRVSPASVKATCSRLRQITSGLLNLETWSMSKMRSKCWRIRNLQIHFSKLLRHIATQALSRQEDEATRVGQLQQLLVQLQAQQAATAQQLQMQQAALMRNQVVSAMSLNQLLQRNLQSPPSGSAEGNTDGPSSG